MVMASDTVNDHADLVENTTSEDANAQGEACGKNGGELTDVEREIIRQVGHDTDTARLPNADNHRSNTTSQMRICQMMHTCSLSQMDLRTGLSILDESLALDACEVTNQRVS